MWNYQIVTDATADFSQSMMRDLPRVEVIPMQVEIDGSVYTYGPSGNISVDEFYGLQRSGKYASTAQINPMVYMGFFEKYLARGTDVLYLSFTSGMSGTYGVAQLCIQELREKYPDRTILGVDTLCASAGEGFLVREAARKQAEGLSVDELYEWVTAHRLQVCHWFTVDIFDHLRHGGRVSAASAAVGTMLQIKPLLHVDDHGALAVVDKPRGRKRAIAIKLEKMKRGWTPELGKLVLVCHGDCPAEAENLRQAVAAQFPDADIHMVDIGPVIGAHTGPGMLALIYWGSTR